MTGGKVPSASSISWKIADAVAIVGLIVLSLYYLTAYRFDTLFTVGTRQVDFAIYYNVPPQIYAYLKYPAALGDPNNPFPYLPSAVLMMLPLQLVPRFVAFGLWIALQMTCLFVVLRVGLRLTGLGDAPGRWLVALLAVLMIEMPLSWDFRNHNNNVIYLALIMLGLATPRAWLSGLLLAVSFNLKLYSATLLAGLAWRREYRTVAAMAAASVLMAVALPLAVFGVDGYLVLMQQWLGELAYTVSPLGRSEAPATLFKAISALLGPGTSMTTVVTVAVGALAAWVALLIGYLFVARRPVLSMTDTKARLSDMCVLLMAPLPFSTRFSPYHAIVLLPAFLLLLSVVVDLAKPLRLRAGILALLAATQLLLLVMPGWELRSLMYLVSFSLTVTALGVVRYAERPATVEAPAEDTAGLAHGTAQRLSVVTADTAS